GMGGRPHPRQHVVRCARAAADPRRRRRTEARMKPRTHPYQSLPDSAFWRQSVAETQASDVDPVVATPFTLSRDDRVAAAGSCFAQHIGRYLSNAGLRYLVTEEAHPLADPATAHEFGYGVYTARFGNLYTARQLRQL